jgi:hypothetical protein
MKQALFVTAFAGLIGTCALNAHQPDLLATDTASGVSIYIQKDKPNRDRFYIGPDMFWTNQSPQLKGIHIKDESVYYGLKAGFDFLTPGSPYVGGHAQYAVGRVHIKAEDHKATFYDDKTTGSFSNAELRLGYNLSGADTIFITPFVGAGGYYVRPFKSINYTQDWVYAAVGMKAELQLASFFSVGLNVKGTRALYLEHRVKKNKHSASQSNASQALGYEVSVPITLKTGHAKYWDLRLEPYYTKLNTHNDSNVFGGQLNLSAKF